MESWKALIVLSNKEVNVAGKVKNRDVHKK